MNKNTYRLLSIVFDTYFKFKTHARTLKVGIDSEGTFKYLIYLTLYLFNK